MASKTELEQEREQLLQKIARLEDTNAAIAAERDDLLAKLTEPVGAGTFTTTVEGAEIVAQVRIKLGEDMPNFFPIRDAEVALHNHLIAAAEADPKSELQITVTR